MFAVHGFQDDNVKLDHLGPWWDGLAAAGVPRKLWLLRAGHTDPSTRAAAVWVDTLHRWFDHWLLDVDNGIMAEPRVTVEESKDVWADYADWPLPGSAAVPVYLRGTTADAAGTLGLSSGGDTDTLSWTSATGGSENTSSPLPRARRRRGACSSRRRSSGTCASPARRSWTSAPRSSTTQSNLGAVLVDYGPGTQTTRAGEGIRTDPVTSTDCWGASTTRQYNGASSTIPPATGR